MEIATKEFLAYLKAIYDPVEYGRSASHSDIENPWYLVTAVTFSASNHPEEVPLVLRYMMDGLEEGGESTDKKRRVVVRMREAIFKAGLLNGYSRAISALIALYDATPGELRDDQLVRESHNKKVSDLISRGDEVFSAMFGDSMNSTKALLDKVHPDMGWFARAIACGHLWGEQSIINQRETSFILIAALIAMDTPIQLKWHLANARRAGASVEEIDSVREIAMQVASKCGVVWRSDLPDAKDLA